MVIFNHFAIVINDMNYGDKRLLFNPSGLKGSSGNYDFCIATLINYKIIIIFSH